MPISFILPLLALLAGSAGAPAPVPKRVVSLFVGFPKGHCEPRGSDHSASLYAASTSLSGKSGCGTGRWTLSPPVMKLASSQLAGNVALLGTDGDATFWGTWLMGSVGGGPPYTQLLTQISISPTGAPTIDWTCHPPRTVIGVPSFDGRISPPSGPLFFTNGSFALFDGSAAAGREGWDAIPSTPDDDVLALLERAPAGAFVRRHESSIAQQSASPTAAAVPDCTVKTLGSFSLAAPGVQQAVVFDTSFPQPSALTVTLSGDGRMVSVQRLNILNGAPMGAAYELECATCDNYLYQPISVSHGILTLSTINYTSSLITSFVGNIVSGEALSPIAGSTEFVQRESDVVAIPSAKGSGAPFPLGLAALQFTMPNDNWACHNSTTVRSVRLGSVAHSGAPVTTLRSCSLPLCAFPTANGGCIIPQFGFL